MPIVKRRATELAYDQLERMISTLELEPNQPIVEGDLIWKTGLGRTPVREALMRLVTSGLIEQQPRRGLRVSEIRIAEHLMLVETRRVLERLIASASARRASSTQGKLILEHAHAMSEAAQHSDLAAYMRADKELDDVNHESSRNPYAVRAVVPLITHCRRFWYAFQQDSDLKRGAQCHLMLAEGIRNKDPEAAVAGADALMDYLSAFTRQVIEN